MTPARWWETGRRRRRRQLEFGVELGSEENGDVGDPQPDQKDHHAAEVPVGLVVGAEVGDVDGERSRGEQPEDDGEQPTRAHPAEARRTVP